MTTRDFTANVISATKVVPDGNFKDSKASGIWDINEALDLIKGGNWPNVANINPAAFVDGLFSTDLYTGNGGAKTITNDINLSGSGGLVWFKPRGEQGTSNLIDSVRGVNKYIRSNATNSESTLVGTLTSFNTNGFTVGEYWSENNKTFVTWTFRKQPKFFDVVTYTGNGTAGKTVAHNLGSVPGMIMVKVTSTSDSWALYHRGANGGTNPEDYMLRLNTNDYAADNADYWNDTAPTDSVFTIGTDPGVNGDGVSYVAYLFAHNNDDGGFGEPGDQDIIKCGYYTGNGSTTGPVIDLGFEPQWIMFKRASGGAGNWGIIDTMRGMVTSGDDAVLFPDDIGEELGINVLEATPTGFQIKRASVFENNNNDTYVYMAIRRGGMQTPTTASDVFKFVNAAGTEPVFVSGFVADMGIWRYASSTNWEIMSRLTGTGRMYPNLTNASGNSSATVWDYQNGWYNDTSVANQTAHGWTWKRARGYFDVVTFTGTGSARTVAHNLGVAPEMFWVKRRDGASGWGVYHAGAGNDKGSKIDTDSAFGSEAYWNSTDPTASVFTLGGGFNDNNATYIAYLFETVADVSKVGSYTGNSSSSQNIDCGFTTEGVEFLLIKSTASGDWYIWDRTRGIASGNDPYLRLNNTAAATTNTDHIDTFSTGFTVNSDFNTENEVYIFYAIARG